MLPTSTRFWKIWLVLAARNPTGAPTLVATLGGLVAFVVLPIARGAPPSSLGGYSTLWRWYDVGEVAHWLAYHLANLELYLAVVPLAVAPIVVVSLYRSARAGSERHAAFLALFLAVNSALLLLTAAVVVATTGDSWAVRMILVDVSLHVAARLYRWSRNPT